MGYKSVIGVGQTNFDTVTVNNIAGIQSGTYNQSTGLVTLTLTANIGILSGAGFTVMGVTGSGANLSSANGNFISAGGVSNSATVTYTIATGLTIASISGGQLNYGGNNNGLTYAQYGPVGGPTPTSAWAVPQPGITPAMGVLNCHSPHTASNMGLWMSNLQNLTTTISQYLVINGVQGNQILNITSGTSATAKVSDATHSDAIANGVTLSFVQAFTGDGTKTGYAVFTGVFWQADQPGGASVPLANTNTAGNGTGGDGSGGAVWYGATGSVYRDSTTLGAAQVGTPNGGTWSALQINMYNNVGSSSTDTSKISHLRTCINPTWQGAGTTATTGNGVIAVPGGTFGILDDATGTDAVPFGSYINTQFDGWSFAFGVYYSAIGSTWTSAQPNVTPFLCAGGFSSFGSSVTVSGFGYCIPRLGPGGYNSPTPIEQPGQVPVGGTFTNANVAFSVSGGAGATFVSSPNGTVGNQTGVIPSSPGTVWDVTHSDAVPAGNYFTNSFTNLTGSFTLASQSAAFTAPAPGSATSAWESNDGLRQASVETATGTALTYDGDWSALFDQAGIAPGPFDGRMLAWLNAQLSASYTSLPEAQEAFALSQGAPNWSSMGSFTA